MGNRHEDPLFGDIPERTLLGNAPLVRVLGQVRFPKIVKIAEESYIADFQEAIRKQYPHFQSEVVQGVELNLAGQELQHRVMSTVIWRFFDPTRVLRISLSQDAITLETAKYVSRDDFLERLGFVLTSLQETIGPSLVQRVGFRYVDRLQGEKILGSLDQLIQPELLNVLQPKLTSNIDISMTEITATTKEGKLIARYGLAPMNYSHDPDMAPPVGERSWVLDVDSYSTDCAGQDFSAKMLCGELDKVAARAYSFFRWSITDQFLEQFGAK
ncbi:TIGR04255 family protein [Sulfitobacter pacificus]|uniref:TIGR04255 family protein n=1 Tax=Sulfitobacter pacificus TaxID=1499314 RepID=A0ABQ5VLV4_9RHOB|nr:TIGR04255 family protein [Sulfitobacter pacificus]GLQ28070.1 hypothetical protein GCM10007927_28730 [Sulfitobacter pacificus]